MTSAALPIPSVGNRARTEVGAAIAVVLVVALLVVPLPAVLLDLALALSIGLSLVVLLVALYTTDPLEFSGLFSTTGTPLSKAIFLMRSATLRLPIATTYGAGATVGSYRSAMAMCVGFTSTTSAFGTSRNICWRTRWRAMLRMRCFTIGSPSLFFSSCFSYSLDMRSDFSCCQSWKP